MTEASFQFRDVESGSAGWCAVRQTPRAVAITMSLEDDGDIEVFLSRDDAARLLQNLQAALEPNRDAG